ncbi:MAG: mechanosensitive ion channel family protein [Gammaproteobacteria bacterium]|nr:mechanosensitive ion channel family protein [Gammaproteobacteria bacterium]
MVNFAERKYSDPTYARSKHQRETVRTVARLGKVITIIIGAIIMLQTLGFSVSGLVAFSGIGAAGIAFAAKDTLGNFFGGLVIFLNRPFTVGDWIRSPDRQIEGTVEEIGWFTTRIRTFEKWPIYVPNGMFSTILIENPQRMTNRRIKQTLGLRYADADKVTAITTAIKEMLLAHPEIDQKQTLIVDLVDFGSSSLDVMIYAFTKTTDWINYQDIQQDVLLKILEIVDQFKAECAYPTSTLYIDNEQALFKTKKES